MIPNIKNLFQSVTKILRRIGKTTDRKFPYDLFVKSASWKDFWNLEYWKAKPTLAVGKIQFRRLAWATCRLIDIAEFVIPFTFLILGIACLEILGINEPPYFLIVLIIWPLSVKLYWRYVPPKVRYWLSILWFSPIGYWITAPFPPDSKGTLAIIFIGLYISLLASTYRIITRNEGLGSEKDSADAEKQYTIKDTNMTVAEEISKYSETPNEADILAEYSYEINNLEKIKSSLLTEPEQKFYHELVTTLEGLDLCVWTQVRLPDVIPMYSRYKTEKSPDIFNMHFDFVICDPDFKIVMVIEYDDPTHEKKQNKFRDILKNLACNQVNLPILRIKSNESYSYESLKERIFQTLTEEQKQNLIQKNNLEAAAAIDETPVLTPSEEDFYNKYLVPMSEILDIDIFFKVKMTDILKNLEQEDCYENMSDEIKQRTIDFVLYETEPPKPLILIEYSESYTEESEKYKNTDEILAMNELRFIRVDSEKNFTALWIQDQIIKNNYFKCVACDKGLSRKQVYYSATKGLKQSPNKFFCASCQSGLPKPIPEYMLEALNHSSEPTKLLELFKEKMATTTETV